MEHNQAGTLIKALTAGMDPDMTLEDTINEATRDMLAFKICMEAVEVQNIRDVATELPSKEWVP